MEASAADLERSIMKTLCWFSVFDYPLSSFEIHKWLVEPACVYELADVVEALDESEWLASRITSHSGMYTLANKDAHDHAQMRARRFVDAVRKYKKLKRAARFFALLPGVRAVAAANTLSWWHTTEQSDIDLFIVTRPGHIWSSRFYLVLPFLLMGNRPHHEHGDHHNGKVDPFCFSFFASQNALQMEHLTLSGRDYYLAFWMKSLVSVFDKDDSLEELHASNHWTRTFLPHVRPSPIHHSFRAPKRSWLPLQTGAFEFLFRSLQRRRFPQTLKELANKDSRVVIHDDMLKFHDNDRRAHYREQFEQALAQYV